MSTLDLLDPSPGEILAVERVLHDALTANSREPDGFFTALSEAILEAAKEARLREFIAECDRDLKPPSVRLASYHGETVDPLATPAETESRFEHRMEMRQEDREFDAAWRFDHATGETRR